jgi:starch-binding outer membrane protein, SusD/RagB family
MKKSILIFSVFALAFGFTGCKKWLEVPPEDVILDKDALKTRDDAQLLLNSCYDVLGNTFDGKVQNLAELLSDNAAKPLNNNDLNAVYAREVGFFNTTTKNVYTDLYRAIYRGNTLLVNFDLIPDLSESEKTRMTAEVRFIRALSTWWAMKIWSQPYGYTADNSHLGVVLRTEPTQDPLPRSTVAACYDFVLADLQYAFDNLPENNGAYASKYAAAAMLSMVYFQKFDYANAKQFAEVVINSNQFSLEPTLDAFHAMDSSYQFQNNPENIFSIVSVNSPTVLDYRNEGFRDNYWPGAAGAQLSLSEEFYNFMVLTPSDKRYQEWVLSENGQFRSLRFGSNADQTYFFPIPILRLTVINLIHAEACAQTGSNLQAAIDEINAIRERAYAPTPNPIDNNSSASEIIDVAREEFRKETFCEGLWIDQIKRIGASEGNYIVRGAPWNCPGMAIQFPVNEFNGNSFVGNDEGGCN